jgi:hypothetical protein
MPPAKGNKHETFPFTAAAQSQPTSEKFTKKNKEKAADVVHQRQRRGGQGQLQLSIMLYR